MNDTPNPDPNPNTEKKPTAEDLARQQAEAEAALEAALAEKMDPKEEAERNLRTTLASLKLELRDAADKLVAAATNIAGGVRALQKPLNEYLNQLGRNLLDAMKGLKDHLDKTSAAQADDIVKRICAYVRKVAWILFFGNILIAVVVVFILRRLYGSL